VRLKTFAADLEELQRLRFWLFAQKVTHVAKESTGVYWKPVEAGVECVDRAVRTAAG
jgi:hypothetical protein